MKRILLLVLLLPAFNYAQEKQESTPGTVVTEPKLTLSFYSISSDPAQFGLSAEYKSKHLSGNRNSSYLLNISAAALDYNNNIANFNGFGVVVDLGSRTYVKKGKWNGFYAENFISYGNLEFSSFFGESGTTYFEGTYSYWSIINPNVGYKFMIGENFCIDPSIGANWKWEVKGKGDIDNKNINNLVIRAGVKIGFIF
ncbi:hypothetical protein ABH942_002031 [Flavobacterium sp. 28YEA47A]|uniref:hypothetical protein n=1 Tax=Flavobacterium sp. 28YEA47A TaxID=3156276 RepID=UPI00351289B8